MVKRTAKRKSRATSFGGKTAGKDQGGKAKVAIRSQAVRSKKSQKDRFTEEWRYVIEGQSIAGDKVGTVTKLSLTGKLIIITVYLV